MLRPLFPSPVPTQDVFYLNSYGHVIQRLVTEGVPGPEFNLGGVLHPGSTVAAAWGPAGTRLDLFGRSTESALVQKTWTWTHGWGPWTARTPAGTLTSSPTAASPSVTRLDVFFRGTDNLLKQATSTNDTWASPRTLPGGGPAVDTAPSAAVTYAPQGRVHVYAGCNGALCEWSYDSSGTVYFWGSVPGARVDADPAATSSGPGRVQVALRNSADRLSLWQNRNGAWTQTDLGQTPSPVGSSIGQAPMSATNTILYARSTQGTLIARTIAP